MEWSKHKSFHPDMIIILFFRFTLNYYFNYYFCNICVLIVSTLHLCNNNSIAIKFYFIFNYAASKYYSRGKTDNFSLKKNKRTDWILFEMLMFTKILLTLTALRCDSGSHENKRNRMKWKINEVCACVSGHVYGVY